jgi:hypothetical protein
MRWQLLKSASGIPASFNPLNPSSPAGEQELQRPYPHELRLQNSKKFATAYRRDCLMNGFDTADGLRSKLERFASVSP